MCAPHKILFRLSNKKDEMAGHMTHTEEVRGVLVRKSEEERSIGRPRRRWEHSIQTDFQEIR